MERRTVLTGLVHGGSATVALIVGVPTLMYALAPGGRSTEEAHWIPIGPISRFRVGGIVSAILRDSANTEADETLAPGLYVWRINEERVVVFSRSCTDLGCPITFDQGSNCFFCPCHGGIFSKNGDPMAGPPDRPLYRYDTKIEAGILYVDTNSVPPMV